MNIRVAVGTGFFLAIRAASFFLRHSPVLQGAIAIAMLAALVFVFFRNPKIAWWMVAGEFFLGGIGQFFELGGLALRTLLAGAFLLLWFTRSILKKRNTPYALCPKPYTLSIMTILASAVVAALLGLARMHPLRLVFADLLPFVFLLLIFPTREFLDREKDKSHLAILVKAFIAGSAVFSIFTLSVFSLGLSEIQSPYYKWFRDIGGGKITDVGNRFFRIVLPEHILLPPALLFMVANWMRRNSKSASQHLTVHISQLTTSVLLWPFILAAIPFLLNVSRTFILAYVAGLLFLLLFFEFRAWWKPAVGSIAAMAILFGLIHIIASRGASLGLELFDARFYGILRPETEMSSAKRRAILPALAEKIKEYPLLGAGLGDTVAYRDPATGHIETTRHFEWGYLELWIKLGAMGFLGFILLSGILLCRLFQTKQSEFFSPFASLLAMTAISPAMFHVAGIYLIAFLASLCFANTSSRAAS